LTCRYAASLLNVALGLSNGHMLLMLNQDTAPESGILLMFGMKDSRLKAAPTCCKQKMKNLNFIM
jgi:hypothetical protein